MAKSPAKRPAADLTTNGKLLADVRKLIVGARAQLARSLNSALVMLYWHVGERIRQKVLQEKQAEYGKQILETLSAKLTVEFGTGWSRRNLAYKSRFRTHCLRN